MQEKGSNPLYSIVRENIMTEKTFCEECRGYEKESGEHKLESVAIAKVVLLLAKEQNEELNLRQLQKVLREVNTVWYFSKGNTLFTEPFVKNVFNEWQLPSVWDRFCGCASRPIPVFTHGYRSMKDLVDALSQPLLTEEDRNYLVDLIRCILKQGKYKDPWSGNCYENQSLASNLEKESDAMQYKEER